MLVNTGTLSSAAAALVVVLGLVWLAARAARASGLSKGRLGTAATPRLAIQDTLALDRIRRLYVIRCDGRDLVILIGGPADVVVGWLPVASEQAA